MVRVMASAVASMGTTFRLATILTASVATKFSGSAMARDSVRAAIIVSSVTFGIGHIVNLFNGSGAELLPNLLQVLYAMAVGFAFVMIYCRTKSLMPCIIVHSVFNGLSAFANEAVMTPGRQIISGVLLTVIGGGYALYLALAVKEANIKN